MLSIEFEFNLIIILFMKKTKYLVAEQLIYFCFNYPRREEVIDWMVNHPQNHCTKEHLMEKIEYYMDCGKYSYPEAWLYFYCNLDGTMKEVFVDYICEVYAKPNMKGHADDYERMNK